MPNLEGNRGTKTILGNREHKKTNFRFLGNRGTSQFISGEQGNMYPPPPGRASLLCKHFKSPRQQSKCKFAYSLVISVSVIPIMHQK